MPLAQAADAAGARAAASAVQGGSGAAAAVLPRRRPRDVVPGADAADDLRRRHAGLLRPRRVRRRQVRLPGRRRGGGGAARRLARSVVAGGAREHRQERRRGLRRHHPRQGAAGAPEEALRAADRHVRGALRRLRLALRPRPAAPPAAEKTATALALQRRALAAAHRLGRLRRRHARRDRHRGPLRRRALRLLLARGFFSVQHHLGAGGAPAGDPDHARRRARDDLLRDVAGLRRGQARREPPRYRWHLGCILLKMPAISLPDRPRCAASATRGSRASPSDAGHSCPSTPACGGPV